MSYQPGLVCSVRLCQTCTSPSFLFFVRLIVPSLTLLLSLFVPHFFSHTQGDKLSVKGCFAWIDNNRRSFTFSFLRPFVPFFLLLLLSSHSAERLFLFFTSPRLSSDSPLSSPLTAQFKLIRTDFCSCSRALSVVCWLPMGVEFPVEPQEVMSLTLPPLR